MKAEIGVIGLGVMGKSLSRNLAQKGFSVSLFNRHLKGKEESVALDFKQAFPELKNSQAFDNLQSFVASLESPKKIIVMIAAGTAMDELLSQITPLLSVDDIIVDGGNSHFEDTQKRIKLLQKKGMHFIGAGISGGEYGALHGPSIMPSGNASAYSKIEKFLKAIAAKDTHGEPCCSYIGSEGSGHFVKMIHNGMEYVEMQLLAECYFILNQQGETNFEIAEVFESWQEDLNSYLLDISVDILRKQVGGVSVLDTILDQAGNKGTGKWSSIAISNLGTPATLIPAALLTRYLSFFKSYRIRLSKNYPRPDFSDQIATAELKDAYGFARIMNHYQGFSTLAKASNQYQWNLNLSNIARIWTQGCIIKSQFMIRLIDVLREENDLLSHPDIQKMIRKRHAAAQSVVAASIRAAYHIPCLAEAVQFFHGIITADSSANLIQAQRDYFGAHGYLKKEDPSGKKYHTEW
ncbi:MAG: NADP-dependent phosphogluconate dehydrogenase [Burkholderiaceae bacterium]